MSFEPKIVGFLCNWCSYTGADLAGTARMKYPPNMTSIRVMCSGRIDPGFILHAFAKGADGVLVCGCHPGDCHYVEGNYKAMRRMPLTKKILKDMGIDPERLRLEWVSASEGGRFQEVVTEFTEQIRALGPLQLKELNFMPGEEGTLDYKVLGENAMAKPKLAIYWAASCGGCDIAILDIEEKILGVVDFFEPVFWPCVLDFKYDDVRQMPDKSITLTLFNGAIRSDENFEIAKLLRRKSVVLCAFGSCAAEGCIPGLANLYDKQSIMDYVYLNSPSVDNPDKVIPQPIYNAPEGEIRIPDLWNTVRTLGQTVDVDYIIPGCPPQSDQIAAVVGAVIDILKNGKPLPPKGTVLGANEKSCCDECPRERNIKKIKKFIRPFEKVTDPNLCLMEQGIVCMGPATRSGCGAKCVKAGVPCRGCYGMPINIRDQGAKMASAIASVIDSTNPEEIQTIIDTIPDPIGTFYRFSLPDSMLRRAQR